MRPDHRHLGRHRRHGHHRFRGPPSLRWLVAHGIYRRVIGFQLIALAVGVGGGWLLRGEVDGGGWGDAAFLLAALPFALVPIGWVAALRIARPIAELARLAGELHDGRLSSRSALRPQGGEVGEVAGALHGLADRLARQLEHQRSLMAAVSHELRSPLARVRVLVELAREGAPAESAAGGRRQSESAAGGRRQSESAAGGRGRSESVYDELQAEVDGMDALVGDLLAAARIDFEAVSPRELDPRDVGARALELAGLEPSLLSVRTPSPVVADATLVARALAVLLDNAVRHGGSPVALVVREEGEAIRFEVEDDGPGFADGEEEQVFQPFWRRPGEGGPGVGLGLALVRQIALAHGGSAGAGNRAEGGARVWLELPAG